MLKAFLSHSSKDKEPYVRLVAASLGPLRVEYDELTFDEGMKSFDEIIRSLDRSDLFVLFLSDSALDSEWVQRELALAEARFNHGLLLQIYPLIIDSHITHADSRILPWMRAEYNLRLVSRPTVAARRIKQQLVRLSWSVHPRLEERRRIFVGRNAQIATIEERLDSFELPIPVSLLASGLSGAGRRSLLKRAASKANVIVDYQDPPSITLSESDSIEDFILKTHDLGLSASPYPNDLLSRPMADKVEFAAGLSRDIRIARELLLIIDQGCIATREGVVATWYQDVCTRLSRDQDLHHLVACVHRLYPRLLRPELYFHIGVPELEPRERNGLFKRYADFEGLTLDQDDLDQFAGMLTGLPEQVFYAVDLIRDLGVREALKQSFTIVEFSSQRVLKSVRDVEDVGALDFLILLSQFDFVGRDLILEVYGDPADALINQLGVKSIVEFIGADREYLRINEAVRDYVLRNFQLVEKYRRRIARHLDAFLQTYEPDTRDVSDVLFSVKEALMSGREVDSRLLIPSHFLRSIRELYDVRGQTEDVIQLADRALSATFAMDARVEHQIRFYLCLALARQRNERFTSEAQHISGADHNFLFGFYYRLKNNYAKALDRLKAALAERPGFTKAKHELTRTLIGMHLYEEAMPIARESYERDGGTNPYFVRTYFECLVHTRPKGEDRRLLDRLLDDLDRIKTQREAEFRAVARAQYAAYVERDYQLARQLLARAADGTTGGALMQIRIVAFYVEAFAHDVDRALKAKANIDELHDKFAFRAERSRINALMLAMQSQVARAVDLATRELRTAYTPEALDDLVRALRAGGRVPPYV